MRKFYRIILVCILALLNTYSVFAADDKPVDRDAIYKEMMGDMQIAFQQGKIIKKLTTTINKECIDVLDASLEKMFVDFSVERYRATLAKDPAREKSLAINQKGMNDYYEQAKSRILARVNDLIKFLNDLPQGSKMTKSALDHLDEEISDLNSNCNHQIDLFEPSLKKALTIF